MRNTEITTFCNGYQIYTVYMPSLNQYMTFIYNKAIMAAERPLHRELSITRDAAINVHKKWIEQCEINPFIDFQKLNEGGY